LKTPQSAASSLLSANDKHKAGEQVGGDHYRKTQIETICVIEDWSLNFNLGNVVKYIARHKYKGKPVEDLKKALWYLQRELDKIETGGDILTK
jgi:hypothetical protein